MDQWVLIAGGFHRSGGMDRLNRALALHLIECGKSVHLVSHSADRELRQSAASVHIVSKPGGSFTFGEFLLARVGRKVARTVADQTPGTRVVVNGGNCGWPDINWVHCVHHAWRHTEEESSRTFLRHKHRLSRWLSCRYEQAALRTARILIANSGRTRSDLIDYLKIDPSRIHTVYPGADPAFSPPSLAHRAAARAWLRKGENKPLIAFVGALGYDSNKGLDVLLPTWRVLCARPDWDADLIVAGDGRARQCWQRRISESGLEERITLLGFTDCIPRLLAAVDLLVSPVRYEAYGLNVHEAICCGVPAMVTQSAGVAERYPEELRELLISKPENVADLVTKLLQWRTAMADWKKRIAPFSKTWRSYTLEVMAQRIVAIAESNSRVNISV
jgi:glycosyltransferase involved in cell wall biosynthesis